MTSVAFRERTLDAGAQRLAVAEAGAGDALLWLGDAPGLGLTRTHEALAARRRVIALSLPGIDGTAGLDALGPTVLAAVPALELSRFDLMGSGRGANLALWLALAQPERVRAVVLLGPTAIGGRDDAIASRLDAITAPSLALFGTRDPVAPPETARHYRARMPGCNLVFVYDAGRAMAAERPEAVSAMIEDFLERHDLFLVSRTNGMIFP